METVPSAAHGTDQQPTLIALETKFIASVVAVFADEKKADAPETKNFLLEGIQSAVAQYNASSPESVHKTTRQLTGLLFDDLVSYELMSQPVLLDSGHTFDKHTLEILRAAGIKNPMTQKKLKVASNQDSNEKVKQVIVHFKAFLRSIQDSRLEGEGLPDYLQEIVPKVSDDEDDEPSHKRENFSKYVKGDLFSPLLPVIESQQHLAGYLAHTLQDLLEFKLEKLTEKRLLADYHVDRFALLLLVLSGAALVSLGLSAFVDGLWIYKAFMLFVAANGLGGFILAGVIVGAGALMVLCGLAYLFWPLSTTAVAFAYWVHDRQENITLYPDLAAAAEAAQVSGRAQRGENIQALRQDFLKVITSWLYSIVWRSGLYRQQQIAEVNVHSVQAQGSERASDSLTALGQGSESDQSNNSHDFTAIHSASHGHHRDSNGVTRRATGGGKAPTAKPVKYK